MALADGIEELLNVMEGDDIFKIIDQDQHDNVIFRVFLLHRRGEKAVLGIVVDHGFCQNGFPVRTPGDGQVGIHKGCHLIHV